MEIFPIDANPLISLISKKQKEIERRKEKKDMTNTNTDSWDHLCGSNFLKVEHIKNEQDALIVLNVEIYEDDDTSRPRLILGRGESEFIFDLNVTNANFCKNNGIKSPKNLIGKKIFFKKVNVISPKTKQEVESLRICKIE